MLVATTVTDNDWNGTIAPRVGDTWPASGYKLASGGNGHWISACDYRGEHDMTHETVYKVELPWGYHWTHDYDLAYQDATGMTLESGTDSTDGEERITAFGEDPRTTECVYCDREVSYSRIVDHHDEEHSRKRFAPFYYPEVFNMEVVD